jgi:UDP-glucose 4-epimerase
MNKKHTILVTGGAGFIGSHLVRRLIKQGKKVRILDDLSTGKEANLSEVSSKVELIIGDISDYQTVSRAMHGCHEAYHLAAVASVPRTVDDPLNSAETNEMGTLKVLEAARQAGVRRVVMASSSAIYGDEPGFPKVESMAGRPLSPYAWHKRAGERHGQLYQDLYGLETVSLRFFNVFGPRQDPSSPYSGVISIFMSRALTGGALTIFGDGEQVRDFIYVGDVARAITLAMESPKAAGKIINVGTGAQTTINRLARAVIQSSGREMPIEHAEPRAGDIKTSYCDPGLAGELLGFEAQTGLEIGLKETWEWFVKDSRE